MPTSVGRRVTLTVATLAPDAYNAPHVFARNRDPYTIYGYEAMKLILDGLNAGGASKEGCSASCAASRTGPACSDATSFDANGDTTLRDLRPATRSARPLAVAARWASERVR